MLILQKRMMHTNSASINRQRTTSQTQQAASATRPSIRKPRRQPTLSEHRAPTVVKPPSKSATGAEGITRPTVASAAKAKGKPDGPVNPLALLSLRAVRWLSMHTNSVSINRQRTTLQTQQAQPTVGGSTRRQKDITAPAGTQPKCVRKHKGCPFVDGDACRRGACEGGCAGCA